MYDVRLVNNLKALKKMILTKYISISTVNDEGVVALLGLGGQSVVEHQAVGAQLLGHGSAVAVIVLVALGWVAVEPIIDGALELGSSSSCISKKRRGYFEKW